MSSLEGGEARNRLLVAVERLLAVVCANGPLVVVLDDIQNAGLGAVDLLEGLLTGESGPLLLMAVARPEQIVPEHPLRGLARQMRGHPRARLIELEPIGPEAVGAFVADSLPGATDVASLAQTIARRTNGRAAVRAADADAAVRARRAATERRWRLELGSGGGRGRAAARGRGRADDRQARAAAGRDSRRGRACGLHRRALRLPRACWRSSELGRERLGAILIDLEDQGLLTRSGAGYRFAQDRIRSAAYASLAEDKRRELHWAIGNELLVHIVDVDELGENRQGDERLFELIDHLDAGVPKQLDEDRRLALAELDLRAGRRALTYSAHELAQRYLVNGIALVGSHSDDVGERGAAVDGERSKPVYELVFWLHFLLARTLAAIGRKDEADVAFAQLLAWPLIERHYAEVVARRLELLWTQTRQPEGFELGFVALERLGLSLPRKPSYELAIEQLTISWQRFREADTASIATMPRCVDEHASSVIDVLAQFKFLTFVIDTSLFLYVVGLHAQLCGTHGYHRTLPKALSDLSFGVSGALEQTDDGVRLQDLGCELARSEPNGSSEARLLALGGLLSLHRGRAFADIITQFETSYQRALETGEFDSAGYLGGFGADMHLEIGTHLRVLDRRGRQVASDVRRGCPPQMRASVWVLRGTCRMLLGGPVPDGDDVWDLQPQSVYSYGGGGPTFQVAAGTKALLTLLFGDSATTLEICMPLHGPSDRLLFNTFFLARLWLLTCVAYYAERLAGGVVPVGAAELVEQDLPRLERWARDSPTNYGHYYDLALGLRYASEGHMQLASEHLDRAWSNARQRGCRWVEGLAAEQLAAQLGRQGLEAPVEGVLQHAWDAFTAWGAEAKLAQLREANPSLFGEHARRHVRRGTTSERDDASSRSTPTTGLVIGSPALDLGRVLHSVGEISEDLRLEEVIGRVLDAALTNVGADHGLLVLDQGGELALVAEVDVVGQRHIFADPPLLRSAIHRAPTSLINFVARTGKSVVLDDAREDLRFAGDAYLDSSEVRSILALPLLKGERRLGVLVLENHLTTHGFGASSIEALRLITSQAASTLENAQLYSALRRSEARWRSLVDGAPDLIALLDERGAMVFRNHAGPLCGVDETDEGNADGGALDPISSARWRDAVQGVLEYGERRELELEYLSADGFSSWYAVRVAPIEIHRGLGNERGGRHRNAVAVATDITERKQAEAEKRELEAQLRQQQRLESVGTLASGVAHEINNPIQGIMNYADLIFGNSRDFELVEDFAKEINIESNRVAKIVRNLLAFSRQDASEEPESVQMIEVVELSLSLIRAVLRSDHIVVDVSAESGLPPVRCRPQQIQQIIMNLVTNARDALKSQYGEYDEHKRIELRVQRSARSGWVRVSVRDFGPGIPAEVLPRIFDPFFTTKGRDQGTGLGLAVSHGIAQEHGGELTVETTRGQGACFILELPGFKED